MLGACLFKDLKRPGKRLNLPQPRETTRRPARLESITPERIPSEYSSVSAAFLKTARVGRGNIFYSDGS